MSRKLRTYADDDIVVEYDARRCIHVAECVRGLPRVFDPAQKPWVAPGRAPADEIAAVVERCPTGALHYTRPDGAVEAPDAENTGRVDSDGPLFLRGRLRLELPGGDVVEDTRVALCRCGASRDKPFCDGSHAEAGFSDHGLLGAGRLVPVEGDGDQDAGSDGGTVCIRCLPNGPLLVRGPLRIEGTDGGISVGQKGSLCRCGASGTKPFCDGSHRTSGFEAAGS